MICHSYTLCHQSVWLLEDLKPPVCVELIPEVTKEIEKKMEQHQRRFYERLVLRWASEDLQSFCNQFALVWLEVRRRQFGFASQMASVW